MSSADDIQAMLDDVYGVCGIPAQWTPAGGAPLTFTALVGGGDQVAQFHGLTAQMNVEPMFIKARVSELAALAPGVVPADGDAVASLDDAGNVVAIFVVTGQPRREDPRRMEWTMDLAEG